MNTRHFLIIFFLFALAVSVPQSLIATGNLKSAPGLLDDTAGKAGISDGDIGSVAGKSINIALQLVGLIFLLLTIYGGLLWMTARGAEDQITKARDIVIAAVIGLVIVISAYAITIFVTGQFQ